MNTVSQFYYLLTLIISCNELFFLIILNSLFTDSLHFSSVFTHGHGFIQLFFNVMNRIKIINQVQLGLLIRSYLIQLILSCRKITIMLLNQNFWMDLGKRKNSRMKMNTVIG